MVPDICLLVCTCITVFDQFVTCIRTNSLAEIFLASLAHTTALHFFRQHFDENYSLKIFILRIFCWIIVYMKTPFKLKK